MKRILFLETTADYQSALEWLRRNPDQREGLLCLNLNGGNVLDGKALGVPCKVEDELLTPGTLSGINEHALALGRQWFEDALLRPLLELEGVNAGLVLENFLVRQVITACKYARLARAVARDIPAEEWLVFGHPAGGPRSGSLIPSNEEKFFNETVEALCGELPRVTLLAGLAQAKPKQAKPWAARNALIPVARLMRYAANAVLKTIRPPVAGEKSVALVGAPRLLFPMMEEFRRERGGIPLLYFQKSFAPRMAQRLMRHQARYKVASDYADASDDLALESFRRELASRWKALCRQERFAELFLWEGIDLRPILAPFFCFAFEHCLPEILLDMRRFRRFFEKENVGLLFIDESVKEFSRPFVLAAASCGVASVELQHGVPDYYVHHRLLTTTLAAWGEYGRRCFIAQSRLNPDDVVVTGSPSLDRLTRRQMEKDIKFIRQRLRVQDSDKIVVFAATPFHLGSRGGVIGEHLTRGQVEYALREILRTTAAMSNTHLVIKLHPTDPNIERVREILRQTGFPRPYSVVKQFDVHTLMHSAALVYSLGSTSVLEALAMEIPVVQLNFFGRPDPYPYAGWGAVARADKPEDLGALTARILGDREGWLSETRQGREKALKEMAAGVDGKAGRRCMAIADGLLRHHFASKKAASEMLLS